MDASTKESLEEPIAGSWRRLWVLLLLAVTVYAASAHFIGIAREPMYQIHSDDPIWMWRFQHAPYAATPGADPERHNAIDQGALDRYVFHYLLLWTGKMPSGEMPTWDYDRDFEWNVAQGHVAPADAVHFVRVINATFMVLAAVLVFAALAKAASPMAGLVGALFFTSHPATVEILWSIGSDPLLWMLMAAVLALWVFLEESWTGVVLVALCAGLAASAKLNGGAVALGYALWLVLKRKPLRAIAAAAISLAAFVATNPVLFGSGLSGVPATLTELVSWRSGQAALMALHYPGYPQAPRWLVFYFLLGMWWPLLPLVLVSPRFLRLQPAVFWGVALVIVNGLTVTAPVARYKMPIEAGLVLGAIAAYWPQALALPFRRKASGIVEGAPSGAADEGK